MKQRNHKACAAVLAAVLLAQSGCTLAQPDAGTDAAQGDRLAGVLITATHLDLFDAERYFSDHLSSWSGGELVVDDPSGQYQGRLYATEVPGIAEQPFPDYTFEGVESVASLLYLTGQEDGVPSSMVSTSGEALTDVVSKVGEQTELTGKVCVTAAGVNDIYVNPVYQDAEGNLYATAGGSSSIGGDGIEGAVLTTRFFEEYTSTTNGAEETESISVEIALEVAFAPTAYTLVQMDEGHNPIQITEILPAALPEEIALLPECAYLVWETRSLDRNGDDVTTREVVDSQAEYLTAYCDNGRGLLCFRLISILH